MEILHPQGYWTRLAPDIVKTQVTIPRQGIWKVPGYRDVVVILLDSANVSHIAYSTRRIDLPNGERSSQDDPMSW